MADDVAIVDHQIDEGDRKVHRLRDSEILGDC